MSPFSQSIFSQAKKSNAFLAVIQKHIVALNSISLILIVAFFILYVVQVNGSVAKGYQMRELETRISELSDQNKELQVAARKSQSLENVSESITMLGLVEADAHTYMQGGASSYALAE